MSDSNMRMAFVEGSPEQLAQFAKLMGLSGGDTVAVPTALAAPAPTSRPPNAPTDGNLMIVTKDFAKQVLTRRPLSNEQAETLKLLKKAYPGEVLATTLQKKLNYTPAQFAGLMGAFGRRLSHTDGYVDDTWFFINNWDHALGCYRYRIPITVKQALDELNIG